MLLHVDCDLLRPLSDDAVVRWSRDDIKGTTSWIRSTPERYPRQTVGIVCGVAACIQGESGPTSKTPVHACQWERPAGACSLFESVNSRATRPWRVVKGYDVAKAPGSRVRVRYGLNDRPGGSVGRIRP